MKAADDNFTKVKACGNLGDEKCDGYNAATGEYFQCYAPEDIQKLSTEKNALKKIQEDITGIVQKWSNIKTIYYVINDKMKGLSSKVNKLIIDLQSNKTLPCIKLFSIERLRRICLSLSSQDKQLILGYAPDLSSSKTTVQFEIVSNIIKFIEETVVKVDYQEKYVVPDFSEKIKFNKLSTKCEDLLNNARYHIFRVDEFFDVFPIYNKGDLKNDLQELYNDSCVSVKDTETDFADKRFFYILNKMVYNDKSKAVIDNAIIIMATFFESCDIFEEPV